MRIGWKALSFGALVVVLCVGAVVALGGYGFLSGQPWLAPPRYVSGAAMLQAKMCIEDLEMEDLASRSKQAEALRSCTSRFPDGWGKALEIQALENGRIAIVSYGSDGREGGSGEAEDIRTIVDISTEQPRSP